MQLISEEKIKELKKIAKEIRISIVEMLYNAGSGHTAGSLGMADIFTYLYFHELKHDPKNSKWEDRDFLILSNGHICPVLYSALAHSGYFDKEELNTLRKFGSRLQGHPHREFLPILENSSGPLGSGYGEASGIALGLKMNKKDNYVYCIIGDGELDEGNNWESFMFASKNNLNNLIGIVDRNNIQIDGYTNEVMPLENLKKKFESFNFHVLEINGHDFYTIDKAIKKAKNTKDKPSIIIAHTIPGRGVSIFEKNYIWHGRVPNKEERDIAIKELEK